ncbi:MAG: hypothetical protein U1E05_13485 [Patescibacteria group bacterium]|nr:hypothetical protein [Patescibacteria group bacterium]
MVSTSKRDSCRFLATVLSIPVVLAIALCGYGLADDSSIRVGVFCVDASPPIGSPVAYVPARTIEDPLSARGIVLLGAGAPIVLCAVDWIGISNGGYDAWREALAAAAGTSVDRVAIHAVHQHDGPRCDFTTEELLAAHGLGGKRYDAPFARRTIEHAAVSVREAVQAARRVTHVGLGQAAVEKVASNRRILGADGRVRVGRMSSCRNPEVIAEPEGVIDPLLRMVSLWDEEEPIVCLSYYATHPQSHYRKGDVTPDFPGLARNQFEKEQAGLLHVYFTGAAGNVAAGKYNDGSPEARVALTSRMADGMRRAWAATTKVPIRAADVAWRVEPVLLPPSEYLEAGEFEKTLADGAAPEGERFSAASKLAYLRRVREERPIELSCLRLADAHLLHMPGELFVEYQLAAQAMRPAAMVCVAAYGQYGAGYIGTEVAYAQGGYETSGTSSNVGPGTEAVLMAAMKRLLHSP